MSTLDYKALREEFGLTAGRIGNGVASQFSPEVAAARKKEQTQRNGLAKARAHGVLMRLYRDEYRSLYLQAKAELDEERGPLPGDEVAS